MSCLTPLTFLHREDLKGIPLPCGTCPNCVTSLRDDWTFRIFQEYKDSYSSSFVTLTYNDDNLSYSKHGIATLVKRDVQLFIKRLRKKQSTLTDVKLRYFACGEYGKQSQRPHYHILFFNNIPQLDYDAIWNMGYCHVGTTTIASIHYTTKYILKRHSQKTYKRLNEFTLCSRRPGIGSAYLKNKQLHSDNLRNYVIGSNGHKMRLPRFFKDKFFSSEKKEKLKTLLSKYHEKSEVKHQRHYTSDDWNKLKSAQKHINTNFDKTTKI